MDIFKGRATAAELARQNDLTVSDIEGWIDEAQHSMENGFRARPKDVREQYEPESREAKEALGRVQQLLALRSDNGLVFSSSHYTGTVKAYGLTQESTTPYTPE